MFGAIRAAARPAAADDGDLAHLANDTTAPASSGTAAPAGSVAVAPAGSAAVAPAGVVASLVNRPVERAADQASSPSQLGHYRLAVVGIDLVAATGGVFAAYLFRFGHSVHYGLSLATSLFAVALPVAWVLAVGANGGYERRFAGVGNAEYDRVFRAFAHLGTACAIAFYVLNAPVARGFAVPALLFALALDLVGRCGARTVLHRQRARGQSMTAVVAVGGAGSLAAFTTMVRRDRHAGIRVVGACLPSVEAADGAGERELAALGVPVLGDVDSIVDVVTTTGAHTVAVLSGEISAQRLRWISWQLEGTDTDLVVSPGMAEFGGRRLHIQPVAGLPLLYIQEPKFSGFGRMVKSVFDRTVAAIALLVFSPALIALGLAVRLTSPGPALFRQTRVGRDGREFRMIKFRSMVNDAEKLRVDLVTRNETDGVLFKIRADPRVTSVGRVLRRFSLDELPQLLNVLGGSMSLVGPRPPLPSEVEQYHDDVRRRLLVKPGLTGLWQVSGRSDLSWEESVRLDLRYVEDWSLSLDMIVLWKTVRAVFRAEGAY